MTHLSAGAIEKAITDLTRAIELNPQHSVAFMLRGEAYGKKGDTDRAIADLTKAIRLGVPDWGHAYGQRGVERLKKGDPKGAVMDLTKAIELENSIPAADSKLATLYLSRGTAFQVIGDLIKAISDLTAALRMDSTLKQLALPLLNNASQGMASLHKSPQQTMKAKTRMKQQKNSSKKQKYKTTNPSRFINNEMEGISIVTPKKTK